MNKLIEKIRKKRLTKVSTPSINVGGAERLFRRYQEAHDSVIGVDITPHAIRICELGIKNGHWFFKNVAESRIQNATDFDLIEKPDRYSIEIQRLVRQHKFSTKRCAIALPVRQTVVNTIEMPLMEEADLQQAIEISGGAFWGNFAQLPEPVQYYSIHHEVLRRDEESGNMDVLFVAAKRMDIDVYLDILSDAGLETTVIDVGCFALYNAMHYQDNVDGASVETAVAYLKLDREDQYVYLIDRGEAFLGELYLSEEDIIQLDERAKTDDFAQNIARQVDQFISSHESVRRGDKVREVCLLSSAFPSEEFVNIIDPHLKGRKAVPYQIMPGAELPESILGDGEGVQYRYAEWAVAIGLAMRNLDPFDHKEALMGVGRVNLVPDLEPFKRMERASFYLKSAFLALSFVSLIVILASFSWMSVRYSSLENVYKLLNEVPESYQEVSGEIEEMKEFTSKMRRLQKVEGALPSNQEELVWAYDHIYRSLPNGVWLMGISFMYPGEITINGNALLDSQILEFVQLLNDSGMFDKVQLVAMQAVREGAGQEVAHKRFDLRCILKGAGEIPDNPARKK